MKIYGSNSYKERLLKQSDAQPIFVSDKEQKQEERRALKRRKKKDYKLRKREEIIEELKNPDSPYHGTPAIRYVPLGKRCTCPKCQALTVGDRMSAREYYRIRSARKN